MTTSKSITEKDNLDQKPTCSSSDERSESESSTPIGRSRTYFTPEQVEMLEKAYDSNPYPDQTEKEQIALKSGLNENKVQVWFSNRRARQRKNLTNSTIYEVTFALFKIVYCLCLVSVAICHYSTATAVCSTAKNRVSGHINSTPNESSRNSATGRSFFEPTTICIICAAANDFVELSTATAIDASSVRFPATTKSTRQMHSVTRKCNKLIEHI